MTYKAAIGDVVRCVRPVYFDDGTVHLPGTLHEVKGDDEEYYSLMTCLSNDQDKPHNYQVYALAGVIIDD